MKKVQLWRTLLILFALAAVIRLIHIGSIPFIGDEANTASEALSFSNVHALSYYILLRFWLLISDSIIWQRLLSLLIGSIAVPVCYVWLASFRGKTVALLTALLLALSPFAVDVSQETRFYAWFSLTVLLLLWAYTSIYLTPGKISRWQWVWLVVSAVLTMTSDLFGIMVVGLVGLHFLITHFNRLPRWQRITAIIVLVVVCVSVGIVLLSPGLKNSAYQVVYRLQGSIGSISYSGGRGLSLISLAKIAFNYYVFVLGQFVYPLILVLVIPSLLCTTIFAIFGFFQLSRLPSKWSVLLVVFVAILPLLILYLAVDPLWPASLANGIAPRYTIFVLPLILWLVAEGAIAVRIPMLRLMSIGAVLLIQMGGLYYLYVPEWHISGKATRVEDIFQAVQSAQDSKPTIVLTGPRADGLAERYLKNTKILFASVDQPEQQLSQDSNTTSFFISDDFHENTLCSYRPVLETMSKWHMIFAHIDYPLIVYGYDLSTPAAVDPNTGRIPFAPALYDVEFSDLKLPQEATWQGKSYPVDEMHFLPDCSGGTALSLTVDSTASSLLIFSDLTNAGGVPNGTPVAYIDIEYTTGATTHFDIRKGYETQAWDQPNVDNTMPALTWHKRLALVGVLGYPDVYRDFQAAIWAANLPLAQTLHVKSIRIQSLLSSLRFNLWGAYLLP